MSYYVSFMIKEIPEIQVLPFAKKIVNKLFEEENAKIILEGNIHNFPSKRLSRGHDKFVELINKPFIEDKVCDDLSFYERQMIDEADEQYLYDLFSFTFVYFRGASLLCLIGSGYPISIAAEFDGRYEFQNSTDQDYSFKYWKQLSKFQKGIEIIKNIKSIKELVLFYKDVLDEDFGVYEDNTDLEYEKRTLCYRYIETMMGVERWIYGEKDTDKYFTFALTNSRQMQRQDLVNIAAKTIGVLRRRALLI